MMDPVIRPRTRTRTRPWMEPGPWLPGALLVLATLVSTVTPSSPGPGLLDPEEPSGPLEPLRSPDPSSEPGYRGNGSGSAEDSGAQGIHLVLRPPDLLAPSLPPPLPPLTPPTRTPPPSWDQLPFLEEAWGSGDYLETLSFLLPEGEELALATPLPDGAGERGAGGPWASDGYAVPARPTLALSSPTASLPPTAGHAPPDVFPSWDDDYDPEAMAPLEPTELLLPDMNSLEYYTNLLARERERQGRRDPPPAPPPPGTIGPTQTQRPALTPPPSPRPPQHGGERPPAASPPAPTPVEPASTRAPPAAPPPTPRPGGDPPGSPAPSTTGRAPWSPPPAPPAGPPLVPQRPGSPSSTASTSSTAQVTAISLTRAPPATTPRAAQPPPTRQYLCNVTRPELYLVRVASSKGSAPGFSQVKELLKKALNSSVELQFLRTPSGFAFRVVSGPLIFTAISVINALRRSSPGSAPSPAVWPVYSVPELRYQVHTVLQFVPAHVDVRVCNFSERMERGLILAYGEARRRWREGGDIGVQLLNITVAAAAALRPSVDITFAVRDGRGYLLGSDVSEHLRKLSLVEFSFYLGFPVLQIAEPFHYPELNTSHHLRSTWVRTVLLQVPEQQVSGRSFRALLERRLALLLQEGLQASSRRRWRRATPVGNNSLQVARVAVLGGAERPLEVFYFVEGPAGERVPAEATAAAINRVDPQRAAIILGHRVQRPLAQPVEAPPIPPAETQSGSVWLVVGVVVPILLALFIIVILYWKLCGSEKLEFQPDAINTIQQRQKLQAPSVKGFDFAKLHLGQHSKDDMLVIQEAGPLPVPAKEATPSDGGDLHTPKSKGSSNKGARSGRRRGRLSPSDADSLASDQSSGRESAEESTRAVATPTEGKQHRKAPKNGSTPDEFLSSTSIFDHVDRLSRGSSDGVRRQGNKVQLIAMQPQPSPPHAAAQPSPSLTEKVALRHKSEIEHHRNKLRQRAKRRGQCEFPSMDDIMDAFGDAAVQGEAAQRLYSSAHDHMDCMVPSEGPSPPAPADARRGRSSPGGRRLQPALGSLPDTDRDRLLAEQSATYRKYPGLNNVAYASDPDLPPDRSSPSPTDEVFDSAPAPPPYLPPQPSIEEARQQMHSLLDDAFALVSPSSQGSTGVGRLSPALPSPAPQARPPGRQWGSYPAGPAHSAFSSRYAELGMSPTSVQGLLHRQGLAPGGFLASGEQLQEPAYPSRGQYEEAPCSSRPPGGSTGVLFQQLAQVGLSSQMGVYPGVGRSMSGPTGSSWNQQPSDQDLDPPRASRESVLSFPEFSSSSGFQVTGSSLQDSAPPLLLSPPAADSPPEDSSPSAHSSASLIKAIREELQRLAQQQAAVSSYP